MVVEVFLVLILLSIWFGFYQIVRQQGRIILRIEALGARIPAAEVPDRHDLEVGAAFPPVELPDLEGTQTPLNSFRGKRVLVVHWSPTCGFCDLVAPDLARLQPELEDRNVQVLLLAYGDVDSNRKLIEEHALRCAVLLYQDAKLPKPLANLGTPSAYLLDQEGRVAKPLAVGSDEVSALAQRIAAEELPQNAIPGDRVKKRLAGEKSLNSSRIVRNGLKAGTQAPQFTLSDIYGHMVSLSSYRGRRVLLVFSDPHCGPCDELMPELARLYREHGAELAIILIGRGEVEENRVKAEQHALGFPIVIQDKWRLSKEYGIFSTPVAFLVDEEGVIARDVAIGSSAIMTLVQEAVQIQKEWRYEFSY